MLSRFIGDAGGAYENIAWANEFIDAADVEWNVLRDSAFSEKGSVRHFQCVIVRFSLFSRLFLTKCVK